MNYMLKKAKQKFSELDTYAVSLIRITMIFFDILIIIGGVFIVLPSVAPVSTGYFIIGSQLADVSLRILTLGFTAAFVYDLLTRYRNHTTK